LKTRRGFSRKAKGIPLALLVALAVLGGCGNPEPPQIRNVQITYWDSANAAWSPLKDGLTAEGSPVRIQGQIVDNTAVVDPVLSLIGRRQDVDAWKQPGFQDSCDGAAGEFFSCKMEIREEEDVYALYPALKAEDLIRGDLYLISLKAREERSAGVGRQLHAAVNEETKDFQIQVRVKEALELDGDGKIRQDYRILEVNNLLGDPNPFLWALSYRNAPGGQEKPLRAGDSLRLQGESRDEVFQICLARVVQVRPDPDTTITYRLESPEKNSAVWKSLGKWNQSFGLSLNAKTGDFSLQFVLLDPRTEEEIDDPDNAPQYAFVLAAHDVPDEGDGQVRWARWGIDPPVRFLFSPPPQVQPQPQQQDPAIVINGYTAGGTTETATAFNLLTGSFSSAAGEVKGLQFVLGNGESGDNRERRVHSLDPDLFALSGAFSGSLHLVSNWQNPAPGQYGVVPNLLKVLAFGMRETEPASGGGAHFLAADPTQNDYRFDFAPPVFTRSPPSLQLVKIFPELNASGVAYLPPGESLRVRAWANDDGGQPEVASWRCSCEAEPDPLNPTGVLCRDCEAGNAMEEGEDAIRSNDLDAAGQFPENPWRWMQVTPESEPASEFRKLDVAVFRASERQADGAAPLFAAAAVAIQKKEETFPDWYTVSLPVVVTRGPLVNLLNGPRNGERITPQAPFDLSATFSPNGVPLNRKLALWNGIYRGVLTLDEATQAWNWLVPEAPRAGDRICIGAESVTGHRAVYLYEFIDAGDQLFVGLALTSDLRQCSVVQGASPAVLLHKYYRRVPEEDGLSSRYYRSVEANLLGGEDPVGEVEVYLSWNGVPVSRDSFRYFDLTGSFFYEPLPAAEVQDHDRACIGTVVGGVVSAYSIRYRTGAGEPDVTVTVHTSLETCEQP